MATSETSSHVYGQKSVSSAGTAVVLDSTDRKLQSILIVAHDDNAGRVFYGASDVDSSTQKGLAPGESITITMGRYPILLSEFYIDAATSSDGVDFVGGRI
jgi:hypothetical protein